MRSVSNPTKKSRNVVFRANPYRQLKSYEMSPEEKRTVSRAISKLEAATYPFSDGEYASYSDLIGMLERGETSYISIAYPEGGSIQGPYLAYMWAVEIPFDRQDTGDWIEEYGHGLETAAEEMDIRTKKLIDKLRAKIGDRKVLYICDVVRDSRASLPESVKEEARRLYREMSADFKRFVKDNDYAIVSESRAKTSYKVIKKEAEEGVWDILHEVKLEDYYDDGEDSYFMVRIPK